MKLVKTFEKFRNHQLQVIELSCEVNRKSDLDDLPYEDFKANLFINHKLVAEISNVLDAADVFVKMIDDIDWFELWNEQYGDLKHAS